MRLTPCCALLLALACAPADRQAGPAAPRPAPARAAGHQVPAIGRVAIEIERGPEPGERVLIGTAAVALGPRAGPLARSFYTSRRRSFELRSFVSSYRPFAAAVPGGRLRFRGRGPAPASETERRRIAEWARLVAAEAAGLAGDAASGPLFAWHRGGGAGGQCEDVVVYRTGEVRASACGRPGERAETLSEGELRRVYAWFDGLRPFQSGDEDETEGDARPERLVFAGRGTRIATAAEQQEIAELCARLHAELLPPRPASPGAGGPVAAAPVPSLLRPLRQPPAAPVVAAPPVPPAPPRDPDPATSPG